MNHWMKNPNERFQDYIRYAQQESQENQKQIISKMSILILGGFLSNLVKPIIPVWQPCMALPRWLLTLDD